MVEDLSPKEGPIKESAASSEELSDSLTEGSGEEAMAVIEAEKLKKLITLKGILDSTEGPAKLEIIEVLLETAAENSMATKEVFEKIGFTPREAEALEDIHLKSEGYGALLKFE